MCVTINSVQELHIYLFRKGLEKLPASPSRKESPALRTPDQQQASEAFACPPPKELWNALRKPCQDCAGTGRITYNPSDEVGHFETRKCPSCSPQAQGKDK